MCGLKQDGPATEFATIDRWDGGVGWIAHPEEAMQRASHALAVDGSVWVIDPVDADGVDDLLGEYGEVAGVLVTLDRHKRDAATIATRHDVPVFLPDWFEGVEDDLDAPVRRYGATVEGAGFEAIPVANNRFWREVALWDEETETLVVPEALGTTELFVVGGERIGVHPVLRAIPPRESLGRFRPERILVGHGAGVLEGATAALDDALTGSRRRFPRLFVKTVRTLLPV